jgi:hypothetical protein
MSFVNNKLRSSWTKSIINDCDDEGNYNSIKLFIIYVPIQQLQGQLQTQESVDTSNYIMDKYNIKSKKSYRQALEEVLINADK